MRCQTLVVAPGVMVMVIACGRGSGPRLPPCACGAPSSKACDFPLVGRAAGRTCSRPLCAKCAATWSLTAPVQPSPAYRHEHGGDLCRIHLGLVEKGHGPALLTLLATLRAGAPKSMRLALEIDAAPLAELPHLLEEAAGQARDFAASRTEAPLRGPLARLVVLGQAMEDVARALRAAGNPVACYDAEANTLLLLRPFQKPIEESP